MFKHYNIDSYKYSIISSDYNSIELGSVIRLGPGWSKQKKKYLTQLTGKPKYQNYNS